MLRTRLSALMRLNLIYFLPLLPTLIVLSLFYMNGTNALNLPDVVDSQLMDVNVGVPQADGSVLVTYDDGSTATYSADHIAMLHEVDGMSDTDMALYTTAKLQVENTAFSGFNVEEKKQETKQEDNGWDLVV